MQKGKFKRDKSLFEQLNGWDAGQPEYRECPAEIGTVGNHANPLTDCFDYHNDIHRLCIVP